jgi:hemerythrin-like metal-binding protein
MRFIWDPKYSASIKSIDTQHQQFFEIINQVYSLIHQKYFSKDDLLAVVNKLIEYGEFHMKYEEDIFKKFSYSGAKEHIAAHENFRHKIKEYLNDLNKPNPDLNNLATNIADFTKTWLSEHILDLDHQYTRFFIIHDIK